MNPMGDGVILSHTLDAISTGVSFDVEGVYLIAPEFDHGGMDFLLEKYPHLKISYSHDSSPYLRMIQISQNMDEDDFILRINGANFCVDIDAANEMVMLGRSYSYDCIRFPDDFPAIFSCDLYSVKGLRRIYANLNDVDPVYHVHPKYYMGMSGCYSCLVYQPNFDKYTDSHLGLIRSCCLQYMYEKRIEVDGDHAIRSGDTITFHYEMAKKYIRNQDVVLDMGCGAGFGAQILASEARKVVGIDLDPVVINRATSVFASESPIEFMVGDVLNIPFETVFDLVVAFEIIEHLPANDLLGQIHKALKPEGLLCLSTPQNSLGHIPTTPDHAREYSLAELIEMVEKYFEVVEVVGIKQGCIYFKNDPSGSNTFLVARKSVKWHGPKDGSQKSAS